MGLARSGQGLRRNAMSLLDTFSLTIVSLSGTKNPSCSSNHGGRFSRRSLKRSRSGARDGARNPVRGRFGNPPGRPRRRSARSSLPGERTVTPVGASMKRGTGLSQGREALGESRGRAPEGERVSRKGTRAAMNARQAATLVCVRAATTPAPFGAPPPLFIGPGGNFSLFDKARAPRRVARTGTFFHLSPRAGRGRASVASEGEGASPRF